MNPVLKQRKTKIVSGWLTRNPDNENVLLWHTDIKRCDLYVFKDSWWSCRKCIMPRELWNPSDFKKLYAGIPRKGRAIHVEIEIVVE
jgi:hypothetical protein